MKHLASSKAVAAGCALVALTNLVILASAAWNRRGAAEARLVVTERELALPEGRQDERSGLMLRLELTGDVPGPVERTARWRHHELPPVEYPWLDRAKLDELGFDTDLDAADPRAAVTYLQRLPRPVYLVVEYDGEAWKRWLARRERQVRELRERVESGSEERAALADAEALLELDRTMRSRLFVVDAGLDADALRRRHGDRARYAVIEGLVRPVVLESDDGGPVLGGAVLGPVVRWVHVPRELGRSLESLLPAESIEEIASRERREAPQGWPAPIAARYRAELAVGHRFEPWLVNVSIGAGSDEARAVD